MDDLISRYRDYSDDGLLQLHHGASDAYANDRSLTDQQKIIAEQFGSELSYYGTDIYRDWGQHVEAMESALTSKGVPFDPIER